jgi:hypothetical protein
MNSVFNYIFSLSNYNLKRLHVHVQLISTIRIHRRDTELFPMVLAEVVVYLIITVGRGQRYGISFFCIVTPLSPRR